jgi:hypothetical protein
VPRGSISKEVQGVSESFGEASELQGAPEIQQAPEIHREPQREEMCIFVACSIIMELLSFVLWDWPHCAVNSMLAQTRLHPDVRKPVCSLDVLRGRRRAR